MFHPCAVIPTYDNPATIARVVDAVRAHVQTIIVVDDGSGAAGAAEVARLGTAALAMTVRLPHNLGKGAAVKTGLRMAKRLRFTHALQIDADGQHDTRDVPRFLAAASAAPESLVLGRPVFDGSAPRLRLVSRKISQFFTDLETGGRVIHDDMCGFRVYPLGRLGNLDMTGNRMDFDIEVAVRLVWRGVPVVNLPTPVRYLSPDQGGVSHYRVSRDTLRIIWMHVRLVLQAPFRLWLRRG